MKKVIILLIFFAPFIKPQNELHSLTNIRLFADFLFCNNDYLRAADEYERILLKEKNDTLNFKLALSYSKINELKKAENLFISLSNNSSFKLESEREFYKTIYLQNYFERLRSINEEKKPEDLSVKKLYLFSYFFTDSKLPEKENYLNAFIEDEEKIISFYNRKINPPNKSPLTAALLSTLIPGLGKIYTEEYTDGIFALITTGLFSFLAYDNFRAEHKFRAWFFTGIASLFYAGNIYGSAASAQIYNAKVQFSFSTDLNQFIINKNYFIPDYNFCK